MLKLKHLVRCVGVAGYLLMGAWLPKNAVAKPLAETEGYSVNFEGFTPCDGCLEPRKLSLSVVDKKAAKTKHVILEGFHAERADDIRVIIVRSLVVVIGPQTHGHQILTFDIESSEGVLKKIRAIDPSMSHGQTRVAYINPMQRFVPETQTMVLSVLDVGVTPSVSGIIYPPSMAGKDAGAPWVEKVDERILSVSPISWSSDDSQLVFFARVGPEEGNRFFVVRVDLSKGLGSPATNTRLVDIAKLIDPHFSNRPARIGFFVKAVEWLDDHNIKARLYPQDYWLAQEISLPLP